MLLDAAKRFEALDAEPGAGDLPRSLVAAIFAGRLGGSCGVWDVAEAAAARRPPRRQPPRSIDLLLDGLVMRFTEGYAAGVPTPASVACVRANEGGKSEDDLRWFGWPAESRRTCGTTRRGISWPAARSNLARDAGALAVLADRGDLSRRRARARRRVRRRGGVDRRGG